MFGLRDPASGQSQRLWPLFAMLIAVVALPTAGVLWFMNQAMQNEQLAVRQRLTEAYRSRLQSAAARIQEFWSERESLLLRTRQEKTASEGFATLVRSGHVDSVLFYSKGHLIYPDVGVPPKVTTEPNGPLWLEARALEYAQNSPGAAAEIYRKIADRGGRESAMAWTAQARCLNKAGRMSDAIELLVRTFDDPKDVNAGDAQGRLILPNALLFALQLMKEPSHPLFQKTAGVLVEQLNDYSTAMPSTQRRFLMRQLRELWQACPPFPTLAAEEMAADFAASKPIRMAPGQVQQAVLSDVWMYQTPDQTCVALLRHGRLLESMNAALGDQGSIPGIKVSVRAPGASGPAFLETKLGEPFSSWQLALNLEGPDPFESVSKQRITNYVWTGILMTAGIAMLSLVMAGYLRRQVRLTRLKNDLVATVSHELKTPLASMRLLVDTLRNGHSHDAQLVQEYLQMIAKENARLSRMIEEFLTFSRMERKKAKFDRSVLQTEEIVHAAVEAVGDRLHAPGCRLDLEIEPQLPSIIGDRDALTTVVVNLLDNALKYTGEAKEIRLRGFASDGNVWLEVQDNGIGFPRSAARKIFNRFYQVDRTLSRRAGGCGLGLSIVRFILAAHNGSITAKSQPGKGSTFTVQLPAA